jgi:hypothetical protein
VVEQRQHSGSHTKGSRTSELAGPNELHSVPPTRPPSDEIVSDATSMRLGLTHRLFFFYFMFFAERTS